MSSTSGRRANADSTAGLLQEIGWSLLTIAVFVVLFYWDIFPVEVTPIRVVGSVLIGGILGIGFTTVAHTKRVRTLWNDQTYRFVMIFFLAIGVQVCLLIAPTWTILSVLVAFAIAIPTRFILYIYARS